MNFLKQLRQCKAAARELRTTSPAERNAVLLTAADLLQTRTEKILAANAKDLRSLPRSTSPAFRDRLLLNEKRLAQMSESLRQVAALEDPLAEEVDRRTLQNGLALRRVRSPLGVILMIFESRPNVATEAFSLAFKSGNCIILRGGRESKHSTAALYAVLYEALDEGGISRDVLWGITKMDRSITQTLLKQRDWIDVVVPRGGDGLIEFVVKNSHIPIIKNDRGMCHVYVDADADLRMAAEIIVNAKTQRPGVCNAIETILVHESLAEKLLPELYEALAELEVQWFVCDKSLRVLKGQPRVRKAQKKNWSTEYLELKLNCRIVPDLTTAIAHIEEFGSRHSECIVTRDEAAARRFQSEVDAAVVYWNASTRFTDGFSMGLGGELGISTQKLHVRGPVGLRELTSVRWIVDGRGQIRI